MSTSAKTGSGGPIAMYNAARNPPKDPQLPEVSYQDKTVVITGATAGVGFEAAIKFLRLGVSRLIIGARTTERGNEARSKIAAAADTSMNIIHVYELDCDDLFSVKAFAAALERDLDRVDVVLLNVGIAAPRYRQTAQEWESTLQINVLASTFLAILMMPKLKTSSRKSGTPSCIQFTGSEAYLDVKPETLKSLGPNETILDFFNQERNFDASALYHVSKLLVMFAQQGLVEHLGADDRVTVLVSSPGMCKTDLGREFPSLMQGFMTIFLFFTARTAEQGSRTLVSGPAQGKAGHGRFWASDRFNERASLLPEEEWNRMQPREWAKLLQVFEALDPGVKETCLKG